MSHFGAAAAFIDIDSIEPGADFVETIADTLARRVVVLVLIGWGERLPWGRQSEVSP